MLNKIVLTVAVSALISFPGYSQDVAKGEKLYMGECKICHGPKAEGMERKKSPKLAGQHAWYTLSQLMNFKKGDRKNATMQGTVSAFTEQEFKDVSAYLETLK